MEELQKADIFETEMDRQTRENMIRFARFMARMIEKYGKEVLEELAAEAAGFRKPAGKITKENAEEAFRQEPKKQKAMVSVKISAETFRRYFSDTAMADVPDVLEKTLEQYFRERTENVS